MNKSELERLWSVLLNPFKIKGCRRQKCFESTSVKDESCFQQLVMGFRVLCMNKADVGEFGSPYSYEFEKLVQGTFDDKA